MSTASPPPSNPSANPSTATAGLRTTDNKPKIRLPRSRFGFLRLLAVVFGLVVFFLVALPMCRTTGREFSPVSFQSRDLTLYRFPGTNIQFLPTFFETQSSLPIAPEILGNLKTLSIPDTWHLYSTNSYGGDSFPADLLLNAITRRNAEDAPSWGAWSSQYPNRAAVLWPLIQSLAIANLYLEIPEILRFAEGYQGTDQQFSRALLTQIHSVLVQHKDFYPASDQSEMLIEAQTEGIPLWSDVQNWIDTNPIPE